MLKKGICGLRTRAGSKSHGRDPRACPGHSLLPSNRLSSQLSGWGPLVRAVRAVDVVAVEALGGQQQLDQRAPAAERRQPPALQGAEGGGVAGGEP